MNHRTLWWAIAIAIASTVALTGSVSAEVLASENWEGYSLSRASPDLGGWDYVKDVASPPWHSLDNRNYSWIGNSGPADSSYPTGYSGEQFVDMNGSYLWQNSGHTFAEGKTYTLSMQATAGVSGQRLYMYLAGHEPVEGPDLGTSLAMDFRDLPDTDFGWNEYQLTYTATAADAGKDIVFALYGRGATYIDDVSLAASAPEPSSIVMSIIGLGGLALAGRWRKRRQTRAQEIATPE